MSYMFMRMEHGRGNLKHLDFKQLVLLVSSFVWCCLAANGLECLVSQLENQTEYNKRLGRITCGILPIVTNLQWQEVVLITEDVDEAEDLTRVTELSKYGLQHILIYGCEVLSGEWVRQVVKTGEDSWRPLNIVLLCSLPCMQTALLQANVLEREYGTQTAFGMSSRWLLIPTGGDSLLDQLDVSNVTMDNVALIRPRKQAVTSQGTTLSSTNDLNVHTLILTPRGREWTKVHIDTRTLQRSDNALIQRLERKQHSFGSPSELGRRIFPNVAHGYNCRHVRVIVKEWLSYLISQNENGTDTWFGLHMDLLKILSQTLNFTYTIVKPADDEWGSGTAADPDTGVFGHIIRKEADLGLAPTDWIPDRSEVMDFTDPVEYTTIVMVYRRPETHDLMILVSILNSEVLLALAGSLLVVSVSIFTMEAAAIFRHEDMERVRQTASAKYVCLSIIDTVFQITAAAMLSEPSEVTLKSRPGRVLLSSWWMFSLVMAAAYSGTLTAFLSVTKDTQPFTSLQDLVTKQHDYKWGTYGRGGIALTLQNGREAVYQEVWAGMQRFAAEDSDVLSENTTKLAEKVRSENFVLFFYERPAQTIFAEDCRVVTVDAGMRQTLASLVLPKGSALTRPISDVIQRLHADGILAQWTANWFPRATCPTASGPIVISLIHLQGVLLIVSVGLGLAFVVLIVEIVYSRANAPFFCR